MSTSTVEKSGLWISLSSLFRPVTSSLQELSLSDKVRRKLRMHCRRRRGTSRTAGRSGSKAPRPVISLDIRRSETLDVFRWLQQ